MAELKLWQAMLAGCDRRAQAYDALFDQDGDMLKSCAMGAAIEGRYPDVEVAQLREDEKQQYLAQLRTDYPILVEDFDWCIERSPGKWTLESIITDANDKQHWTREQIALEIVKPKEEAQDDPESAA